MKLWRNSEILVVQFLWLMNPSSFDDATNNSHNNSLCLPTACQMTRSWCSRLSIPTTSWPVKKSFRLKFPAVRGASRGLCDPSMKSIPPFSSRLYELSHVRRRVATDAELLYQALELNHAKANCRNGGSHRVPVVSELHHDRTGQKLTYNDIVSA